MPCEYFLLIRRQRRPCLLAIDDGLSLAGQHAGRGQRPVIATQIADSRVKEPLLAPQTISGSGFIEYLRAATVSNWAHSMGP